MHLQRSKTISNMCYSKQKVREGGGGGSSSKSSASSQISESKKTANGDTTHHVDSRLKQVITLFKSNLKSTNPYNVGTHVKLSRSRGLKKLLGTF